MSFTAAQYCIPISAFFFTETACNNNNNNNNIQTSTPQGQTLVLQSFWELTCTNIPEIDCFDLIYKKLNENQQPNKQVNDC